MASLHRLCPLLWKLVLEIRKMKIWATFYFSELASFNLAKWVEIKLAKISIFTLNLGSYQPSPTGQIVHAFNICWYLEQFLSHFGTICCKTYIYCKSRKFHLRLIFAISAVEANPWKLKASKMFTLLII